MATIQKRGNSYRITVSDGYDNVGKQLRRTMTWTPPAGMTSRQITKELDRQAVLFEEKVRNGQWTDGNITLAAFVDKWFSEYAEKNLKPKTLAMYRNMFCRVNPALGHIRMDKLRPAHLVEFYNMLTEQDNQNTLTFKAAPLLAELVENAEGTNVDLCKRAGVAIATLEAAQAGRNVSAKSADKIAAALHLPRDKVFIPSGNLRKLSATTVRKHHLFLSVVFSTAVEWQVISENPCTRVKPPRVEHKEALYLDEKQTLILLDAIQTQPFRYRATVTVLLYTGMRVGELVGLEWGDVDFQNQLIHIRRTSTYIAGKGAADNATKTKKSNRVIKVPAAVMDILTRQRAEQCEQRLLLGDQWHESGKVFTQENGNPFVASTLSQWLKRFSTRLGLPSITAHSLRHTNATLLIAGGTNIRTVAGRLGHASTAITGAIYTHAIQTADEIAAATLDDMLTIQKKA